MSKYKLRPYQKSDLKAYNKLSKEHQHILFGSATGSGKSVYIYKLVKKETKKGGKVLVIAPRRKLVRQLTDTLAEFVPSVIMGADTRYDVNSNVFVASTPTLHNRLKKGGKKYLGDVTLVIIDEAHINHMASSMSMVNKHYWESAKWVGFSATPLDAQGYRLEGYDHTLYEHQTQDLIDIGWLAPVKVMVEDVPRGLDDLSMTAGDYNEGELAQFMSEDARVSNVYSIWDKYCKNRRTMIFAVNIAHADIIHGDFIKHNVKAGVVHSNIDEVDEDETLQRFENGEIDVVISVGKLTTGFDQTNVDALIFARPTKSRRLSMQMYGRGLRLHKGKKECLILDLSGLVNSLGYPTARVDFNRVRPERGETELVEFADIVCPHCDYSVQRKNCLKKVIETKHHITRQVLCPNCHKLIDEVVQETKEIERLKLVKDYTNTSKVSDQMIGEFVVKMQKNRDYKPAWTNYLAKAYNKDKTFNEGVKLLYNRWEAGLINLETATNNVMKLQKTLNII